LGSLIAELKILLSDGIRKQKVPLRKEERDIQIVLAQQPYRGGLVERLFEKENIPTKTYGKYE